MKLTKMKQIVDGVSGFLFTSMNRGKSSTAVITLEFIINLLLAVGLYAMVLFGYYFTIGIAFEKLSVVTNVTRVVNKIESFLKVFLTPDQRKILVSSIPKDISSSNKDDERIKLKNRSILLKATLWVTTLFLVLCTVSFGLYFVMCWVARRQRVSFTPLSSICTDVIILAVLVFFTEVFFMFLIGVHWNSVTVANVYAEVLNKLLEISSNK